MPSVIVLRKCQDLKGRDSGDNVLFPKEAVLAQGPFILSIVPLPCRWVPKHFIARAVLSLIAFGDCPL